MPRARWAAVTRAGASFVSRAGLGTYPPLLLYARPDEDAAEHRRPLLPAGHVRVLGEERQVRGEHGQVVVLPAQRPARHRASWLVGGGHWQDMGSSGPGVAVIRARLRKGEFCWMLAASRADSSSH